MDIAGFTVAETSIPRISSSDLVHLSLEVNGLVHLGRGVESIKLIVELLKWSIQERNSDDKQDLSQS